MTRTRVIGMLALAAVLFVPLSTYSVLGAPALHKASGGGSFAASGTSGDNEFQFAFTSHQLDENGTARGQFEYHNVTNGTMLHLEISHMVVEGNVVWLGGTVTKAVGASAQVGDERIVRLQDNGEGGGATGPDKCSKLSNKPAGDALAKPGLALIPLDRGNVQIR